jgi:hypothetical protein
MIIGTVAWFWKGYLELGLCLMIWAIWIETISGSSAILARLTPSEESLKKVKELFDSVKRKAE